MLATPRRIADSRGFFSESFRADLLAADGIEGAARLLPHPLKEQGSSGKTGIWRPHSATPRSTRPEVFK